MKKKKKKTKGERLGWAPLVEAKPINLADALKIKGNSRGLNNVYFK